MNVFFKGILIPNLILAGLISTFYLKWTLPVLFFPVLFSQVGHFSAYQNLWQVLSCFALRIDVFFFPFPWQRRRRNTLLLHVLLLVATASRIENLVKVFYHSLAVVRKRPPNSIRCVVWHSKLLNSLFSNPATNTVQILMECSVL